MYATCKIDGILRFVSTKTRKNAENAEVTSGYLGVFYNQSNSFCPVYNS